MILPEPVLEEVEGIVVVRDDLLPGGTKRRALGSLFAFWPHREFVFGGPAQGFAQLGMAWAGRDAGKETTYFVARRRELHPRTAEAQRVGASIIEVPAGRLSVVQARAKHYAAQSQGRRFLPLGFDLPEMLKATADVARALPIRPDQVWCVAGSGLLTRALQLAWPGADHHAVQIGFPPDVGAAQLHKAPERFEEPPQQPPPFPSTPEYDAKAWRFIRQQAIPGALFWNVAGF